MDLINNIEIQTIYLLDLEDDVPEMFSKICRRNQLFFYKICNMVFHIFSSSFFSDLERCEPTDPTHSWEGGGAEGILSNFILKGNTWA